MPTATMLSLTAGYPSYKHPRRKKKKTFTMSEKATHFLPPMNFKTNTVQSDYIGIIGTANMLPVDKETKLFFATMVPKMSLKTVEPVKLPPIFEGSYCEKLRSSHHHKLVPQVLDPPKLRRLGSGLMPSAIDSAILTDLMSLLDSHRQLNFDADLPAVDSASHSSYGGSFKGATVPQHSVKGHSAKTRSWPYGIDEAGKEFIGNTPVVTLREGSSSPCGSVTSLPQLPAIKKHPLTPIKDVSRETTQNIMLPPIHGADGIPDVNVEPPTPQHSTLMKTPATDAQDNQDVHVVPSQDDNGEWKTVEKRLPQRKRKGDQSHHSSMESIPHSGVQSIPSKNRPHWKGSQQSLGSRKGRVDFENYGSSSSSHTEPGSVIGDGSVKGSVICAPDGEIISVGGSVAPPARHSDVASLHDVMTVNKRVGDGEAEESIPSDDEPEEWKQSRQRVHAEGGVVVMDKKHAHKDSTASEQMLVDALTEHAQKIAQSVLQNAESGHNLETDIRDAIDEIMRNQRTSSVDMTATEYREQIRNSLTTAVAKAAGLTPDSLPANAEVSPELLDALANQSLSPDDIEIVRDEATGKSTLRSKSQLSKVMGGVKEGHIFVPPGGSDEQPVSIQAERVTVKDVGDVDVINYGLSEPGEITEQDQRSKGSSKASSKAPSVKGGESDRSSRKPSETSQTIAVDDVDEAVKILEQETTEAAPPGGSEKNVTPDAISEKGSTKTGTSKVSQKSAESKKSGKKKPVPLEDREEFVVGKPKAPPKVEKPLPAKKEVKKKEKKTKKKKEKVEAPPPPPPPPKEPSPPARVVTPKRESPEPIESPAVSPDNKSEDMDFVFVRDTTQTPEVKEPTPVPKEPTPPPRPPSIEEASEPSDEEDDGVKQISNKDARLAKRAAALAKKREEVERRRKEKEEEIRRQKDESERQEQLKREMEEERKRRDEERRLRKLREEEERKREEQASFDRERRKQQEMERERRAKEEYQRKLEEMRRKQAEEEQRRLEAQLQRQREEEERRLEEEEMMSKMAEQERLEYERRKREEEELRRQREEEEKRRREEEAQRALEEAKRLAEEMARRQAELEARLKFNRDLQLESHGLSHTQDITRMFVFSYFELLQWLGLDIPEFELQKLLQFNKT